MMPATMSKPRLPHCGFDACHPRARPAHLDLTRRQLVAGLGLALGLSGGAAASDAPWRLLLAPSTASVLVARAVRDGAIGPVELDVWRSPDQLRAAVAAGTADVFTLPTNVAANLHNRGLPLRFATVLAAGPMQLVTRAADIHELGDLRGRTVQLYFRHDMPDIALRWLLAQAGLRPGRDVALAYAGSAVEASQLLLAGRAETALLNEPAASTVLLEAETAGLPLRRAFTLQAAWAEAAGAPLRRTLLPMAGLAVTAELQRTEPARLAALQGAIAAAAEWARAAPMAAGELGAKALGFRADAVAEALASADITIAAASTARADIERLLAALASLEPALIGGRLPGDDFYAAL